MVLCSVLLIVRANQCREHGRQEHKHERLNQPDQQFQKVKWHRKQQHKESLGPGGMLDGPGQRFEQVFAGKNVSVEPEAQRNWPESNGEHLQKPDSEENHNHEILDKAAAVALGAKKVEGETPNAIGPQRTNQPEL